MSSAELCYPVRWRIKMNFIDTPFGRIIVSEDVPKDTILLVPPVTHRIHENLATGERKEWLEWNPKAAGIITNVKL
jgi:hypothetical protein